ncbi:MAG: hypothetical protein GXP25_14970 [Planctomycetes bacterium]|nr:hypothetical protein [Planctomycetota bacterium]
MGRFLFGIVVEIFFETICFFIGEIVIYVVSFGRWKTSLQKGNQTPRRQIVTALIGLIVIVCTIAVIAWSLWPANDRGEPDEAGTSQTSARTQCLPSGRHAQMDSGASRIRMQQGFGVLEPCSSLCVAEAMLRPRAAAWLPPKKAQAWLARSKDRLHGSSANVFQRQSNMRLIAASIRLLRRT